MLNSIDPGPSAHRTRGWIGKFSMLVVASLFVLAASAQEDKRLAFAATITAGELRDNLSIIASDALEGRETGTRGQKMAAAFIKHHFRSIGLAGPAGDGFYQPFDLYRVGKGVTYLHARGQQYDNLEEVVYYGQGDSGGAVKVPLVYAGLAREEDFEQIDVKGSAVLIRIENQRLYNLPEVARARAKGARMVFLWNTDTMDEYSPLVRQATATLNDDNLTLKKPVPSATDPGVFMVSPLIVEKLMAQSVEKLKAIARADPSRRALRQVAPVSVEYRVSLGIEAVPTENVLGYLEGTDKKDELLVITAHYDHIGKSPHNKGDKINNGADDDGSGTVVVMQLAKAFAAARDAGYRPRRSILFMLVTGEEKGLLGSDYYTRNPVFPLEHTIANLNIDMVGRRDPLHQDGNDYLYVIGSDRISSDLHELSESVNRQYGKLDFDYTYNDEDHPTQLFYRSDHWNFAKKNIPVIFYFDGIHEDYHRPSDEVEKIDFDLLAKRGRCIFHTAWEIVNRERKVAPDM